MSIDSTNSLNHYITYNPSELSKNLISNIQFYSTVQKVSWVAFAAILASTLTISYLGIVLSPISQAVLIGGIISTPFIMLGINLLNEKKAVFQSILDVEANVQIELAKLSNLTEDDISDFLHLNEIVISQNSLNLLKLHSPNTPLFSLKPLIARYHYFSNESIKFHHLYQSCIQAQLIGRQLLLTSRQAGWRYHEFQSIPRAFDAAVMLQIIQEPTSNISIKDLGHFIAKTFEERMFDRNFEPKNDDYFVFHPDKNKLNLTLEQIENNFHPKQIRKLLFDEQLPV